MWWRLTKNGLEIFIKVKTASKTNAILGITLDEKWLIVSVKDRPIEGKANSNLIRFMSQTLNVPISYLSISKGQKLTLKHLLITTCWPHQSETILNIKNLGNMNPINHLL